MQSQSIVTYVAQGFVEGYDGSIHTLVGCWKAVWATDGLQTGIAGIAAVFYRASLIRFYRAL